MFNYKYHVFCCVNERPEDNPKGSCCAKGSADVLDYFRGTVHEKGIKKEVKVTGTKCLGACSRGPSAVVYPEGVWYTVPTQKDAREIIEEHILKGNPVERLRMRGKQ